VKVLIITTSYPRSDVDPSGVFIRRLATSMVRAGVKITVLAPGDRYAKAGETHQGIDIVRFVYAPKFLMRIGYGDGGIPENLRRWPWLFIILPFFLLSMVIHAIILAGKCDIIHANWLQTGFFSLPAKIIRKKPLVVTLRGSDLIKNASIIFPFVVRGANAITAVNQKWVEELRTKFGCDVFYTPNGVDISDKPIDLKARFDIGNNEVVVLYVGALRKVKGADLLPKIARITYEVDQSIRFLVVGPGDPKEFKLEGLPNITCTGGIPPDDVLAIYRHCDIFLLPSRSEGRPNALLEAMASGLPAVATRLPGVLEVVTDESAILVDVEDAFALAKGICRLARDPDSRKAMGQKARERIAGLSIDWGSSVKTYLRIYEEVCECAAFAG
jgi:glycosyltransferase involved in cell wall biosynthesis